MGNDAAGIPIGTFIATLDGATVDPEQRGKFFGFDFAKDGFLLTPKGGFLRVALKPETFPTIKRYAQAFEKLQGDLNTGDMAFQDLLFVNITSPVDGNLVIHATVSANLKESQGAFRIVLDDTPPGPVGNGFASFVQTGNEPQSGAIVLVEPVTAGTHKVALQWRSGNGNQVIIEPVSNPDYDHASLFCYVDA